MPQKETKKALTNKLKRAMESIDQGRYSAVGEPQPHGRHIYSDMQELGITDIEKYWDIVYECIQYALEDPIGCYRGGRYPKKQTKDKGPSKGKPMIPFEVVHEAYEVPLYFKFCIVEKPEGVFTYYHIDCHGPRKHHEY